MANHDPIVSDSDTEEHAAAWFLWFRAQVAEALASKETFFLPSE